MALLGSVTSCTHSWGLRMQRSQAEVLTSCPQLQNPKTLLHSYCTALKGESLWSSVLETSLCATRQSVTSFKVRVVSPMVARLVGELLAYMAEHSHNRLSAGGRSGILVVWAQSMCEKDSPGKPHESLSLRRET